MNKLLTKELLVKLQKIFFIGFFLIASSIFSLYALSYEECFQIERTKAQREGVSFEKAINLAENVCKSSEETTFIKSQVKSRIRPRFYGGLSFNPIGSINRNIDNRSVNTTIVQSSFESESINGSGIKLGFYFPSWRGSLQRYNFQFEAIETNLSLVIFDYLHSSGFFVGGGVGSGGYKEKGLSIKEKGSANATNIDSKFEIFSLGANTIATNIGFKFEIDSLLIDLGVFYTSFSFSFGKNIAGDTIKADVALSIGSLYTGIGYTF